MQSATNPPPQQTATKATASDGARPTRRVRISPHPLIILLHATSVTLQKSVKIFNPRLQLLPAISPLLVVVSTSRKLHIDLSPSAVHTVYV